MPKAKAMHPQTGKPRTVTVKDGRVYRKNVPAAEPNNEYALAQQDREDLGPVVKVTPVTKRKPQGVAAGMKPVVQVRQR